MKKNIFQCNSRKQNRKNRQYNAFRSMHVTKLLNVYTHKMRVEYGKLI